MRQYQRNIRYNRILVVFLLFCFCVTGCHKKQNKENKPKLTEITIAIDGEVDTRYTGIYVAMHKGYFEERGIKVSLITPPDSQSLEQVALREAEFGFSSQDELAYYYHSNPDANIMAIAAMVQHNTLGILSLQKEGIDSPARLQDHRFITSDSLIEQAIVRELVKNDGGDFEQVTLSSTYVEDVVSALEGSEDAIIADYGMEGIQCEVAGYPTNFIPLNERIEALDFYHSVMVGNKEYINQNQELTKDFMEAVCEGYHYAVNHSEKAAEIMLEENKKLDEKYIRASQEYMSQQYEEDDGIFGVIDLERWNNYYKWLNKKKILDKPIELGIGFSNEYLPKK